MQPSHFHREDCFNTGLDLQKSDRKKATLHTLQTNPPRMHTCMHVIGQRSALQDEVSLIFFSHNELSGHSLTVEKDGCNILWLNLPTLQQHVIYRMSFGFHMFVYRTNMQKNRFLSSFFTHFFDASFFLFQEDTSLQVTGSSCYMHDSKNAFVTTKWRGKCRLTAYYAL